MAIMKYTTLLFKAVKNTRQKQDSGSSRPSESSNRYHRNDTCPSRHDGALLLSENANSNNTPKNSLARRIPAITLNDDEAPLVPTYSAASSDPFVDQPASIPELDLSTLRANATALRTAIDAQDQGQAHLQTPASQPPPFRVIVVGGGPEGLVLAHALHLAGIDYTLIERCLQTNPFADDNDGTGDDTEDDTGLILWPHTARILDQLGLLRRIYKLSCPVRTRRTYHADGTPCPSPSDVFARAPQDHGRPCMLVGRAALLRLLREALPERAARVRAGKEVVSVETRAEAGVVVTCADGSAEEGSVVVGCDGASGAVGRAVRALRAEGKSAARRKRRFSFGLGGGGGDGKADGVTEARYYGLVGSAPLLDELEPGVCYETRGDASGRTFQVLVGNDTAYFLAYVRLDRPARKRTSYTARDADYLAGALARHPVTDKIKFGDLWQARRGGRMVDFHEGIADKWYHDRVVLAGGAAHSMTPALGLGPNTGIQGVAELANRLRRLLLHSSGSTTVGGGGQGADTASIKDVFKDYQNSHDDAARRAMLISSFYTRAAAHQGGRRNPLDSLYGWVTVDTLGDVALLERQAAWAVRLGITLDFVEEKHFREGRLRWANRRRRVDSAASAEEQRRGRTVWVHPGVPFRVRAT